MTTSAVQLEVAGKQTLLFPVDETADRRHMFKELNMKNHNEILKYHRHQALGYIVLFQLCL